MDYTGRVIYSVVVLMTLILSSCQFVELESEEPEWDSQLNILWLVAEDLGPYIPAFGDSTIETPNLDRLAEEGVRYTRVFSPSGVCAPSRAAIATGMYPSRTGAMHMRTGPWSGRNPSQEAMEIYCSL